MIEQGQIHRDGFKFRYHIEGKGPTALVIGSALYYERAFSQVLRQQLRMVFVDWRGFAEAPHIPTSAVDFDKLLEDIEQLRHQLDLGTVILIGHSAHALMALEYAKTYQQHVSHVVMIGSSPNLSARYAALTHQAWQESVWPERKAALEKRIESLPDKELEKLAIEQRFVVWYVRRDPQAWYDFNFDSMWLWKDVIPNMQLLDYFYGNVLRDLDIGKGLNSFKKPVFLAMGRFDFIAAPFYTWEFFRSLFHNFTLRIFEHSGHSPHYEQSSLFDQELLSWLQQHPMS